MIGLDIVNVHESVFSGRVESAVFPGEAGELGVLHGHAPLLARLKAGAVRVRVPGKENPETFFISGGLLEVQPDHVTVLADVAVRGQGLDELRAIEVMRQAQMALTQAKARQDFAAIEAQFAVVMNALINIRRR
jgi:F-type H+-transporting ATPase subunit epsilon